MVTLHDAYAKQSSGEFLQAVRDALALVHSQFSLWTVDLSQHAVGLEAHHSSLYNANLAVGKLQNKILDMDKEIKLLRSTRTMVNAPTSPALYETAQQNP